MADTKNAQYQRIILLNRLVSMSVTRARDHQPPLHGAKELLEIIDARRKKGHAIEFENSVDDDDEIVRAKNGKGSNWLRLRQIKFSEANDFRYATLLMEYVDQRERSFPVVHITKFEGREISGEEEERGAIAAHVVIRMPTTDYDDGSYRCAVEVMPSIPRRDIEGFLSRQVRRYADSIELSFSVDVPGKGKKRKSVTKTFRYHPKFALVADIGRKLSELTAGGRVLSHMIFVKRQEKQSIGKRTSVAHDEFYADVELRVSAKQAPSDPEEQKGWLHRVTEWYREMDYEPRVYYRNISGGVLSGEVSHAEAGAADLVMCPRETITLDKQPSRWRATINAEIEKKMKLLLDNDALWQRGQH